MEENRMTDAGSIAAEIGETDVVADHSRKVYAVVGVTDVSRLPTVDGFDPVPYE